MSSAEKYRGSSQFEIQAKDFEPAYLKLHRTGELQKRAQKAIEKMECCTFCPRECKVNRKANEMGVCQVGRHALVSSYFAHTGEENCLRGCNGSGTIFFSMCNLRCVFCQNYDISQEKNGMEVTAEYLAKIMIHLQGMGCHNINWVTPEHVVPQILEALPYAVDMGLRLPIVYNTSSYDSIESLRLMDGIVDIYMPDFKIWGKEEAKKYLKAEDYSEVACKVIREMQRQVGDLVFDERGLAKRGVLVRYLVMPEDVANTREIMNFLFHEISSHVYVNIMAQYHPSNDVNHEKYSEINRRLYAKEYERTYQIAREIGLYRFDIRS